MKRLQRGQDAATYPRREGRGASCRNFDVGCGSLGHLALYPFRHPRQQGVTTAQNNIGVQVGPGGWVAAEDTIEDQLVQTCVG